MMLGQSPSRIALLAVMLLSNVQDQILFIVLWAFLDKIFYMVISYTSSGKQARPEQAIKAPRQLEVASPIPSRCGPINAPRCQTASSSNEITLHSYHQEFFSAVDWRFELRYSNCFSVLNRESNRIGTN